EFSDPLMAPGPDVVGFGTTAAVLAVAGTLIAGTYNYRITFEQANTLTQSSASLSVGINVTVPSQQVRLSNVPRGPTGTSSRKIYRKGPADANYKLVGTIADNTTPTFDDNTADGAGGAARTKSILFPHWAPLTDSFDSLSISSVAIDPLAANTIYAG